MNRHATATVSGRLRRSAARIAAGPALAVLLTLTAAVPAHAATATAGDTWSQVMIQKLSLGTYGARLSAQLPGLRTNATTRKAELAAAQRTEAATAATLADATATDQRVRSRYQAAHDAAVAASNAVVAAQKRRPVNNSLITSARNARTSANRAVRELAPGVDSSARALAEASTAHTAATRAATTATSAYQAATRAVTTTGQKLAELPGRRSALAAQATALSGQVVTETRATFTGAQTTQVYGITVNRVIAIPFRLMIDDAARAGVPLSGGGFRTREQQIALRRANGCPDLYTAPASACRVPTAIPGRSLHELGLAIDMTSNGGSVNSRTSPAFRWLAAHAGEYGLTNLPSEPWHWSITGS